MTAKAPATKKKAAVIIQTPGGTITSTRVAWKIDGRDVYVWRTDPGVEPHYWPSASAAQEWIDAALASCTPKEKAESGFVIVVP